MRCFVQVQVNVLVLTSVNALNPENIVRDNMVTVIFNTRFG